MRFDEYVGLPFKERGRDRSGIDCYGIVRLVLGERAGAWQPMFTGDDPKGSTITDRAKSYSQVEVGSNKIFDVAIILSEIRTANGFELAPIHMGIFIEPDKILHINHGHTSRVDHVSVFGNRIYEVLRVI